MADEEIGTFTWIDYLLFGLMLCISAGIGVFHAFAGGKQKTSKEFLMAGRGMNPIPVAISLTVSFISAITVLGTPAEIYLYGIEFCIYCFAYAFSILTACYLYMPLFHDLQLTSVYEYIEKRFNNTVRVSATLLFFVYMVIYMGIVIYAPALALNQVTGFNLWAMVVTVGAVCTFYTTIGGMKAVLWTDVFQCVIMLSGFLAVIIQGSIEAGGWAKVMDIAREGGRLNLFDFNPDPTVRHTFWTLSIGGTFIWAATYSTNQAQVQRYCCCRTKKEAAIALLLNIPGLVILVGLSAMAGLAMYARYHDCDPYTAEKVSKTDQLIPYFVLDILSFAPGIPGLFMACIFSGSMSTVSSGLNSLAAIAGQDTVKKLWPDISEERYTLVTKVLALGFGCLSIGMAYVSSFLGSILEFALSIAGILNGPIFALFTLGMFFPWANSIGALVGLLSSLTFTMWIGVGAIIYPPYNPEKLTLSTEGCSDNFTSTVPPFSSEDYPAVAVVYSVSYAYYGLIAWIVCITVGLITSFITGPTDPETLDPRLIVPLADKFLCCLPVSWKERLYCKVNHSQEHKEMPAEKHVVGVQVDVDNNESGDDKFFREKFEMVSPVELKKLE